MVLALFHMVLAIPQEFGRKLEKSISKEADSGIRNVRTMDQLG
jgi:hypothetical protein